jgi:hypothetical protein
MVNWVVLMFGLEIHLLHISLCKGIVPELAVTNPVPKCLLHLVKYRYWMRIACLKPWLRRTRWLRNCFAVGAAGVAGCALTTILMTAEYNPALVSCKGMRS